MPISCAAFRKKAGWCIGDASRAPALFTAAPGQRVSIANGAGRASSSCVPRRVKLPADAGAIIDH
jgi:hypothetical protein